MTESQQRHSLAQGSNRQSQTTNSIADGEGRQDLTGELLNIDDEAGDLDALMSDPTTKKKRRRRNKKQKRNKKTGAPDNEDLGDEEQEMDGGVQSNQDSRQGHQFSQSGPPVSSAAGQHPRATAGGDR